jgi:hypothetical protein
MFQSRGAILAIAVTAIASVLLVAGMGISRTQGAGTDIAYPDLSGGVSITLPDNTGTPPQSPSEPPSAVPSNPTGNPAGTTDATTPGTNPENTGGQAGAAGGPNALPNAGFGPDAGASDASTMLVLLGLAGTLLVGAGATVVGTTRRK